MKHLNLVQRYEISAHLKAGFSQKEIAKLLKVSTSTISRELKRNKTKRGDYSPIQAQENYEFRKDRFLQPRKLTVSMQKIIKQKLVEE